MCNLGAYRGLKQKRGRDISAMGQRHVGQLWKTTLRSTRDGGTVWVRKERKEEVRDGRGGWFYDGQLWCFVLRQIGVVFGLRWVGWSEVGV